MAAITHSAKLEPETRVRARHAGPEVADAMHVGLVSCSPQASMEEAARAMLEHGIHHLVVIDQNGEFGVLSEADLLANADRMSAGVTAGQLARRAVGTAAADMPLDDAVQELGAGRLELLIVVSSTAPPTPVGALTAADVADYLAQVSEPHQGIVSEVMRAGVVLCDPDATAREVARAMKDHGARLVVVLDVEGETMGVIDQRALLRAWSNPDGMTAQQLMSTEATTIGPDATVAEAASAMAGAGQVQALVEPSVPTEASGRWSYWKERGLPRGVVSVESVIQGILGGAALPPPISAYAADVKARPQLRLVIAAVIVLFVLAAVAVATVFVVSGGSCLPIQVAHARC